MNKEIQFMRHVLLYLSNRYKHMTFHFGNVELYSLLVIAILAFAFYSISPSYAAVVCNNKIIFDNSQYPSNAYFFSHSMFITVTLDPICFPNPPPNVSVQITSVADPVGIPLLTFNNIIGTSSYTLPTSYVNFTTIYSSNTVGPSIRVDKSLSDTITVQAMLQGAIIANSTTAIQGDDFGGPISSLPVPPQPDLTTKPICTSGKGIDGLCNEWKIYNPVGFSGLDIPVSSIQQSSCTNIKCGTTSAEFKWSCNPSNPDPLNSCPKVGAKDVYVEVDFLKGHRPDINALTNVVKSYAAQGIQLHIQVDDEIPFHADHVSPPTNGNAANTDFDNLKKAFFGTASDRTVPSGNNQWVSDLLTEKRFAFHYAIFTHSQGTGSGASGQAELPGNDIDVSLGNFTGGVGSPDDQAGTFMHELGHNLGLHHGGIDDTNCKPNYWSVMNWAMQFSSLYSGTTRPLDYSHEALPSYPTSPSGKLDKTILNEVSGVTSTRYYSPNSSTLFIYGDSSGNAHIGYGGYTKSYQNVMWLPFRSDTYDVTNNKNNGIVISGTPIYKIIANKPALPFYGPDSTTAVNVNYSPSLVPSQITLSAWVYKNDTANAYLISKWNSGSGSGSYLLGLEGSNNTPVFALAKSGVETRVYASSIINQGAWYHIAGTYDGSTMKIFVNGQLAGSLAYTGGMNTGTDNLAIGRAFTWSNAATLKGDLDDVQIWNYALSSYDITNLNGGVQPNPQNVLWLPFGGNLFDASGSQNNGILTGGNELYDTRTIPAGTSSTSLIFDGSTTAVNVNYSPSLVPSQITLSAWVYKTDSSNAYLISKWNSGSGSGSYLLGLEGSNNTPVFALAKSGVETRVYASSIINQGAWYHIAGTYDGSTMKIFVNGQLAGSLAYTGGMNTGTDNLAIGRAFTWSNAATLKGDLDDVQIWNYALSPYDVSNLYGGVQQPGSTLINSADYEGDRILQTSVSDSYVNQINAAGCSPANNLFVNGNPLMGFDDWNNLQIDMWNPSWTTSSMQDGATR